MWDHAIVDTNVSISIQWNEWIHFRLNNVSTETKFPVDCCHQIQTRCGQCVPTSDMADDNRLPRIHIWCWNNLLFCDAKLLRRQQTLNILVLERIRVSTVTPTAGERLTSCRRESKCLSSVAYYPYATMMIMIEYEKALKYDEVSECLLLYHCTSRAWLHASLHRKEPVLQIRKKHSALNRWMLHAKH